MPQPDIPFAEIKAVIDPYPKQYRQKQKIPPNRPLCPQRAQKTIPQSSTAAQQKSNTEKICGLCRSSHLPSRLQKPPLGRGSV